MSVSKVTGFRASDGAIFALEIDAIEHDRRSDVLKHVADKLADRATPETVVDSILEAFHIIKRTGEDHIL